MMQELIFKIGAKLANGFAPTIDETQNSLFKFKKEMIDLNKAQNEIKNFQNLQSEMIQTRNKIVSTKAELSRLKAELEKNPSNQLRAEVKKTAENLTTLEGKLKNQITKYSELKTSLTENGVNVKKLRKEYERLGNEFSDIEKKQNRYLKIQEKANNWKQINPISVAKDFALAAPVAGAIKLSLDDSTAFSDVKKQSGLAGAELEEFKYSILDATKHIPMMNKEIYALSAQALQSGVPIKEMTQFTSDAATVATAFDMQASEAAKTMATWRSAFKMSQPQVMQLADVVNYLGNTLATTPSEITKVINGVGSVGKIAGVSEKQTAALAAQILAQGKNADIAKTGLKNMFLTLAAGESATTRQKEAYKKLGFTSKQVAKGMQQDAEGTLFDILKSVQTLDGDERASVLSDLFGKESIEIVAALIGDVSKLKGVFSDVNNESKYLNSAMDEFNNKLADPATQLELAKKAMMQTGIQAGNVLLPYVVSLAQKAGQFFNWISQIQRENPLLLKGFMLLATSLLAINASIGVSKFLFGNLLSTGLKIYDNWDKIKNIINITKDTIPMLSGGFAKVSALVSKMNLGMLMNPWVLGIAAVAAGAFLIIKNWDTVKKWFVKFVDFVAGIFKWLWEHSALKLMIDGVGKLFSFFGKNKQPQTKANVENTNVTEMKSVPDISDSSNSLVTSESKVQNSTLNNSPQFNITQHITYTGNEEKMNPDLKKEIATSSQEAFEKSMKELERRNKRLAFN